MVKLLMRFYDVDSGSITLNGHDIRDFDRSAQMCIRDSLRCHCAGGPRLGHGHSAGHHCKIGRAHV